MTRFDVVVLPEVEAEIREAFHWYFERSAIAADAFRSEVLDAIDCLETTAITWLSPPNRHDGHSLFVDSVADMKRNRENIPDSISRRATTLRIPASAASGLEASQLSEGSSAHSPTCSPSSGDQVTR